MDDAFIETAKEAARAAGAVLLAKRKDHGEVRYKKAKDIVTQADSAAEEIIIRTIRAKFPGHGFLAEESGETNAKVSHVWIIDPLDGTTNYAWGLPFFNVSIALAINGVIQVGVVYDPLHDELFSAQRGKGALCNGARIAVSIRDTIEKALLLHDGRNSASLTGGDVENFFRLEKRFHASRMMGTSALELCYVACGRYDVYLKGKQHPWDIAAGILIIEEAGGRVHCAQGTPLLRTDVIATNARLHSTIRTALGGGA